GYVVIGLTQNYGVPFLLGLPIAFVLVGLFTIIIERLVFRYFYGTDDLTQVLLTIGLVFMSIAVATYFWGPGYQSVEVPAWLTGQTDVFGLTLERYRIFLVVVGGLLSLIL